MRLTPLWLPGVLLLLTTGVRGAEPAGLFPFVLPWDDASPGVTNVSGWGHRPAGKFGPVRAGPDGHLYAGDARIRFFGVNLCFAANFPAKADAGKVAARLARFGVNAVRFHHMDTSPYPQGIRDPRAAGTGDLAPDALDRLDFLFARLREQGIYGDLNLLVGRPFNMGDGLPAEVEQLPRETRHVAGFFYEPLRRLQQDYARKLLTHRNPYTGLTYAEDPAVAFVEICNENGLVHGWLGNRLDNLPEVFLAELRRPWNDWLRRHHGSTEALRRAWGVKAEAPRAELLTNPRFAGGTEGWGLEQHEGAKAAAAADNDVPAAFGGTAPAARSVRLTVTRPGAEGWHVQFRQSGFKVRGGRPYTLAFWARTDRPRKARVLVAQAKDPWKPLGPAEEFALDTAWRSFRFTFLAGATEDDARIVFTDLARQTGTVWLAGPSLRPGGVVGLDPGERLEDGSVPTFSHARFGARTPEGQRDWLRFLVETEDAYWQGMARYLKDDLKVRGVVVGTIVGCSTPNLMARLDAVDTHAYWQHPQFPGRPWDPENWRVPNRTMVNEAGGTLPGLAVRRVAGKPHVVTEYNHPAPNTHGSEGLVLLAAYAGLQDWDALFAFAYSHRADWDLRRIPSFFDIDQHPTHLVTLPAAAALFARGDVKAAREQVVAALDREREVDLLRSSRSWELVHAGYVGVPSATALVHRVALVTEGRPGPAEPTGKQPALTGPRYASDTGELLWDLSAKGRGVVTVNTPRSKAVIGYGGGKHFDLDGVGIAPGATVQEGWSVITLTVTEGNLAAGPARLLVTATGTAENTGMHWKTPAKDSVGRNWGKAPSLVEGIPARLTLPRPSAAVQAWALDERGRRGVALPVQEEGGRAIVDIGPPRRTLWYEIEMR